VTLIQDYLFFKIILYCCYLTILVSLVIEGGIGIFDIIGFDQSLIVIKQVLHDVYGLCQDGMIIRATAHGKIV
jgi:hypothetical protein